MDLDGTFSKAWQDLRRDSTDSDIETRVDVYLCTPSFVGVKIRGGRNHSNPNYAQPWEVKLRQEEQLPSRNIDDNPIVSESTTPGLERWEKYLVKWDDVHSVVQRKGRPPEECQLLKEAMEANIQVAVQKRRVNFWCPSDQVHKELAELTIMDISVQKAGTRQSVSPADFGIAEIWYSACVELHGGNPETQSTFLQAIHRHAKQIRNNSSTKKMGKWPAERECYIWRISHLVIGFRITRYSDNINPLLWIFLRRTRVHHLPTHSFLVVACLHSFLPSIFLFVAPQ